MEIYNTNMERIEKTDLSLGYLRPDIRKVHHEAVEGVQEEWHYEVIQEYPNGGRDVLRVIDKPGVQAKDAWDEEIPIQIYVPYTKEELERIEEENGRPTQEARITALEKQLKAFETAYFQESGRSMSMTDIFRSIGRADALRIQEEACLSGTTLTDDALPDRQERE